MRQILLSNWCKLSKYNKAEILTKRFESILFRDNYYSEIVVRPIQASTLHPLVVAGICVLESNLSKKIKLEMSYIMQVNRIMLIGIN